MGLDNSITMKLIIKPEWADILGYKEASFEIAYWRKCWNFRSDILNFLDTDED